MLYTQFVLFAMDVDQERAAAAVIIGVLLKRRKTKHRKKRSVWVKPWAWLQRRNKLGVYHTLLQELRIEAEDEYKKFLRMSPEVFDELLTLVKPEIEKETTKLWDPTLSFHIFPLELSYLQIWHLCFCRQWKLHPRDIFLPSKC